MKLIRIFTLILFFNGGDAVFAQTIDPVRITKADPATVKVNEETTVTIEATVMASETLIPNSINLLRYNQSNELVANLGAMFDDGTNGDQIAGDRIYTRRISLKEALAGSLLLKASAAYRGQMRRLLSTAQEIKVTSASTTNLSITILEPFDQAAVDEDTITVRGQFEGPLGTGVSVNGIGAGTSGKQFATTLTLTAGANQITVAATLVDGTTVKKNITVTRSAVNSNLLVAATETEGLAPLRVGYLARMVQGQISKIEVDFDGNGTFDTVSSDASKPIYHVFEQAGLYQSIVQITDAEQRKQQKKLAIVVQSKEELDQTLRSMWDEFLQVLNELQNEPVSEPTNKPPSLKSEVAKVTIESATVEGDVPTLPILLSYLSGEARDIYKTILPLVPKSDIPQIILALRNPITLRLSPNIVEYGVNRTRNGKKVAFIITYIKGTDGIWRLKAF